MAFCPYLTAGLALTMFILYARQCIPSTAHCLLWHIYVKMPNFSQIQILEQGQDPPVNSLLHYLKAKKAIISAIHL